MKGTPENLKTINLKRGDTLHQRASLDVNSSLLAIVWIDKWSIRMVSTMHTVEIHVSSKKDRTGAEKQKPACVLEYRALM